MNPRAQPRRWAAPLLALGITALGVAWAFPVELTGWRASAIVCGWAGTGLLVACLALMVRQPKFARLMGGLDEMYRWHHVCGVLAYLLLLAHPLALALDGLAESRRTAWQEIAPWLQSWPVLLGWGALLLLMAGLAASFSRRLAYRPWRATHALLAVAVLAGLAHVGVLLSELAVLGVLGAITFVALGWRWLGADLGWQSLPYLVERVTHPAAHMVEATLAPCGPALRVSPGQFVLAAFCDGEHYRGCGEYHPFTASAAHTDGRIELTMKALGACSQRLQALEPGVGVRLQGPFGHFLCERQDAPQLWIAGGIGITPFIASLRDAVPRAPTALIYVFRAAEDAAFLAELQAIAASTPAFELIHLACGNAPPPVDRLLDGIDELAAREVNLCGPAPMVSAFREALISRGVAHASIHFESFDFR